METTKTISSPAEPASPLVEQARHFVWEQFDQHHDPRLLFHSYHYTRDLYRTAGELCRQAGVDTAITELVQVAAWLLPTGYLHDYAHPAATSRQQALRFLSSQQQEITWTADHLATLIERVGKQQAPQNTAEQILSDAYHIVTYIENYDTRHTLLRLEQELLLDRRHSAMEWAQWELQELLRVKLYTPHARLHYEPRLAEHILGRKQRIEKLSRREDIRTPAEPTGPFQQLEAGNTARAIQTFFRANYRNHINLSAIADNKANIMISVNSILISVLITFLSYRNIGENNPRILLPVVIFIVSGAASLIFAVLSARPKVTSLHQEGTLPSISQKNLVFFGNFVHLQLEQYEAAMDAMFRSDELIYGNMTRDLYHLGKVLDKKYRYLSVSYTVFMIGFVATVVSFLILLFS